MSKWINTVASWLSQNWQDQEDSLLDMTSRMGMDRRINTRVLIPMLSPEIPCPILKFQNQSFSLIDLSIGGVCLADPSNGFTVELGQDTAVHWHWQNEKVPLIVRVVGVSFEKKHLQFVKFPEALSEKLIEMVQLGWSGSRLRKAWFDGNNHSLKSNVREMWMGPAGEHLCVYEESPLTVRLSTQSLVASLTDEAPFVQVTKWDKEHLSLNPHFLLGLLLANAPLNRYLKRDLERILKSAVSPDKSGNTKR